MRRGRLQALAPALVVAACLVPGSATPAGAATLEHALEDQLDGSGSPGGAFRYVFGVAPDSSGGPSDGDVYVANLREGEESLLSYVTKLHPNGAYAGVHLDGANTPQGSFSFLDSGALALSGVAVDSAPGPGRGDVYVADAEHDVVDRFDESGEYLCQISAAAAPVPSECAGLVGSATPAGGFEPVGLATDPADGTLYVADAAHDVIDEFDRSGAYIGQIADSHLTAPSALAVAADGGLYVVNGGLFGGESAVKFDSSGAFEATLPVVSPIAVAVDRATGHAYFSEEGGADDIAELDAAGNPVGTFGAGAEQLPVSLAVVPASGRIYAGALRFEGTSVVDAYSPETLVPDVSVAPASAVGETGATLSGEVDPAGGGDVTSCSFEYGPPDAPYSLTAPCSPPPPYSAPTGVGADLTGLTPSTDYRFRLTTANDGSPPYTEGVPAHSAAGTLITEGPPTVDAQSADEIERTAALLHATINPHGYATEFRFEFVDDTHFQEAGFSGPATRSTHFSQVGAGLTPLEVNQGIAGLSVGTTYHYRAVAVSPRGTTTGPESSFTTLPVATIGRQWAYAHFESATVEATVEPLGLATECRVEYVPQSEFDDSGYAEARTRPCVAPVGPSPEGGTARAELPDLRSDTTYHFRFVATNSSGEARGGDESFSTFGIESLKVETVDEEGNPDNQAGSHPYEAITRYTFKHTMVPLGEGAGSEGSLDGFLKDVLTEFPPGRTAGSTEAAPKCPGYLAEEERCPGKSQVGQIRVEYYEGGGLSTETRALYNVVTPDGVASRYSSIDPYTRSDAHIRSGSDYGTTAGSSNITEEARIVAVTSTTWGVPADPSHDPERRCAPEESPCTSDAPRLAIVRNPTSCSGPLTATGRVDTWERPGVFVSAKAQIPEMTGCDKLQYDPSIKWQPSVSVAESPTGLDVDIHSTQDESPEKLGTPDLRHVVISPSQGLVLNPAAAQGLVGCAPDQIALHSEAADHCPDASKVGTIEINTPVLENPLHGGIYIATPHENPFGSLFAIYIAVHDPATGVVVKLAGKIEANGSDGGLTTDFADDPQIPVEDFRLHFFDGPRAVLRTPQACGVDVAEAELTPWSAPFSGPPAQRSDSYRIDSLPGGGPCFTRPEDAPERAALSAGTTSPAAGAYAPFSLQLRREDGTQQIADLSVAPPPGLLGRLKGIARCPDSALEAAARRAGTAEQARPSCPADSAVGTVSVAAGAGSAPYYVDGRAYLAGPYRGAPLSLAFVVPAVAGPYDLGTVVVRTALNLELETGRLKVEADAIPTILEGVSLDVRSIAVRLDRPGFTLNPTSCARRETHAHLVSVFGDSFDVSAPFQARDCKRLHFAPRIGMRLFGKTHRGAHPRLRAALQMPAGDANIASVAVALPPSEFLDTTHIHNICTRAQFAAAACPPGSVYGHVTAWSPLLDAPLSGPVYMRSSHRRLPELVADLNGQFRLAVAGRLGTAGGGIEARVQGVPDAPVERFVLTMRGGPDGLLQNSENICTSSQRATIRFKAQSGKVTVRRPLLRARCPGGGLKR